MINLKRQMSRGWKKYQILYRLRITFNCKLNVKFIQLNYKESKQNKAEAAKYCVEGDPKRKILNIINANERERKKNSFER